MTCCNSGGGLDAC